MSEEIKKIAKELSQGDVKSALNLFKQEKLSLQDVFTPLIEESAKTGIFLCLSRGDVDGAFDISAHFLDASNAASAYETEEIIRQAVLSSLKTGSIGNALKIQKVFKLKKDLMDEIVKHSILSVFSEGNIERVVEIRDKFPVTRDIADKIVDYCVTWGDKRKINKVETIFFAPHKA